MTEGKCKGCGETIGWITSEKTGKNMPVNLKRKTIVTDEGRVYTGYESHFATCLQAKNFRRSSPGG